MVQENKVNSRRALLAARLADELNGSSRGEIRPRAERSSFPLSSVQKKLWFTEQYHPGTLVSNTRSCQRLRGRLNIEALEAALGTVLERHEALRARFETIDGQPVQAIAAPTPIELRRVDFSDRPKETREREALDFAQEETERPFDLAAGGLFRAALLRLAADDHILVLSVHHIVFDGWSLGILFRELGAAYSAAVGSAGAAALPPFEIQYADFAAWQQDWIEQEQAATQLAYWSNKLAGANLKLELPLDWRRPASETFNGAQAVFEIPAAAAELLTTVARRHGGTLYMALYAAFRIVLSRHTGEKDLLVGTPVAGRVRSQFEQLIGCFTNTVVLRTPIDEDKTFVELLRSIKEDVLQALANQELPFDRLVEKMQPERDLSRHAVIQTFFALQNALMGDLELEGLQVSPAPMVTRSARYDLSLDIFQNGGALRCVFEYASDLFAPATIDRLMGHFDCLLQAIAARPEAKVAELDMLTPAERSQMVLDWNRTETPYPEYLCLHELIEAQARLTPGAIAIEFQNQSLTYAELDERSTKLANHLRRLGVKVESLVGICLERSLEMVVAALAVMKAGGAYVPLDPAFPVARIAYMLEDSASPVVVTDEDQLWRFREYTGHVVRVRTGAAAIAAESNELQASGVRSENLAYVIYTSGSTGKPKGVMLPHRAIVNLLYAMKHQPGFGQQDTMLAVTTLSFDIAALELYLPLIAGGRVVVADRETLIDGKKLAAELQSRQVTMMQATPGTWNLLLDSGWAGDRRLKALCGGEPMSRDFAEALGSKVASLWNMYGPTETTVWSTLAAIERDPEGSILIGRPIANTTVYLFDDRNRPVAPGVAGRLHIGGKGLARGYRNLPELTGQAFITNPLPECEGERIYNTGDFARYRADGQLECLGRADSQIKIRGYRIELGEIESALRQHPGVADAVAAIKGSGSADKRLLAWILPAESGALSAPEIQEHAASVLPPYMMPSGFVFIDAIPRTPNGKVDRNALPLPDPAVRTPGENRAAPQTPLESKLLHIFEDLLQVAGAGVTDSFFDLGGHSLLATRLITRIEKEIGHNIPVATLFQAPTVRQLARKIEDRTYTTAWSPLVELRKGSRLAGQPLFCIHWLDAKLLTFQKIASMLRDQRPVYGLQPEGLEGREHPPRTIKDLAAIYKREIRACRPHGPYHLTGSCLGGVVAFEIAQQLISEGEQVGLLLLIDAFMPGTLDHLHDRPTAVRYADWYFGEFLLSPFAAIKRWTREGIARTFGSRRGAGFSARASNRLRKVNIKAATTYQPQPYSGKITLLMCSDGPSRTYEDRRLAWSGVAEGGLEIHIVPGNHGTMDNEANIRVLGEHFQRCFDSIESHPHLPALPVKVRQSVADKAGEVLVPSTCA